MRQSNFVSLQKAINDFSIHTIFSLQRAINKKTDVPNCMMRRFRGKRVDVEKANAHIPATLSSNGGHPYIVHRAKRCGHIAHK